MNRVYTYDADWGFAPSFDWLPIAVVVVLALALWVALARSRFIRGGSMERPERVPQLYAYTVCLVAIIVMLTSLSTIVDRSFGLADPLLGGGSELSFAEPAVTSFEAYRATRDREQRFGPTGDRQPVEVVSDSELRRRYEALRADRLARAQFDTRRDLTRSIILFLVAAALFWLHWRWVRAPERRWGDIALSALGDSGSSA